MYLKETEEIRELAQKLEEETRGFTKIRNTLSESDLKNSLKIKLAEAIDSLSSVKNKEDAKAIQKETIFLMVNFLIFLSKWIFYTIKREIPADFSITPVSDGSIKIDWTIKESLSLLVNIKEDGQMTYVAKINDKEMSQGPFETNLFNEGQYGENFLEFFKEILEPKQKADS